MQKMQKMKEEPSLIRWLIRSIDGDAYRAGRLQIHLDLFSPVGGKYRRETEDFCEYYHSDDFLCRQLSASGLELLGRFADYALEPVGKTTQRIHYVAQKRRT